MPRTRLQKAPKEIPADVAGRFSSADKLSDADRKAVLDIATRSLAPSYLSRSVRRSQEMSGDIQSFVAGSMARAILKALCAP